MKLLILDGNSVINRAYYGVRPLTTRDGLYTHAIYGFLNILERMEKEEKPDAVCVAFDLHGPTFRHLQYEGYKATRHAMPEELAQQMPVMKQVLSAMNIPIYACQGWEADDVIGTVGRLCGENGWDCIIVTGDRDSLQLIDAPEKDGILAVCLLMEIMSVGGDIATLYQGLTEQYGLPYYTRVDVPTDEEAKKRVQSFKKEDLKDLQSVAGEKVTGVRDSDGIKVYLENAWFLVRPSGTENILKFYAETFVNEQHLQQILEEGRKIFGV